MAMDNKKRLGIVAAIGAVFGALALICYKFFPKMKEMCCPPKKK